MFSKRTACARINPITVIRQPISNNKNYNPLIPKLRNMTTSAQDAKKLLRKEIKTRLSRLSESEITTQSQLAQQAILNHEAYKQASSLSIYLSMPASEAQTDLLVKDALGSGKKVFVPFLYLPSQGNPPSTGGRKRKVMDLLRLESVAEYEGLGRDAWGIPSLSKDGVEVRENVMGGKGLTLAGDGATKEGMESGTLDLVVVPAVAFDAQMNRLGHGAGFYDEFLTRFCQDGGRKKPYLEQILGLEHKIPTADWDWKVDAVAVGDGSVLTLK